MEKAVARAEMAEVVFKRGASAFAKGKYQETIEALTHCLNMEKAEEYRYVEADAYNTLGMLFFFAGYETTALDYYLSALESARKQFHTGGVVSTLFSQGKSMAGHFRIICRRRKRQNRICVVTTCG